MTTGRMRRRLRTAEAVLCLLLVSALRRSTPIRRWSRLLGRPRPATFVPPSGRLLEEPARGVAVALASAQARLPMKTTCLDQAVAGSFMLRIRGDRPAVVIGLAKSDPSAGSHAWLVNGAGAVMVGGAVMKNFSAVTEFR